MRKLLTVVLLLALSVQAAAQESDRTKAENEGKEAAASALKFMKGNMQSFTGSITGQTKLKTMEGEEYSAAVKQSTQQVGSIVLELVNGELYASITNRLPKTYISAICENGFVSCNLGTWNNCKYYVFSNGTFRSAASFQELVSCYCVSQGACGFKWSKDWLTWALNKFTSMMNYNSYSYTDDVSSNYAERKFISSSQFTVSESSLKNDSSNLEKINDNGFVKAYKENPYLSNSKTYKCEIKNVPILTPVERKIPCDKIVSIWGDEYCFLAKSGSYNTKGSLKGIRVKLYPGQNLVARIVRDDDNCRNDEKYIKVFKNGTLVNTLSYNKEVWKCGPNGNVWTAVVYWNNQKVPEEANFSFEFFDRDGGKSDAHVHLEVFQKRKYKDDDIHLNKSNNCSVPASCKLKEEQICDLDGKCVVTVRNFVKTGNVPFVQQTTFTSSATGYKWTIYADGNSIVAINQFGKKEVLQKGNNSWFVIKRVYQCSDTGMKVDSAVERGKDILDKSYYKNGKVGYSGGFGCTLLENRWICQVNGKSYSSQSECEANCSANISVNVGNFPYLTCKVGNSEGVYVCKVLLSGQIRTYSKENGLVPNEVDKGGAPTYEFRVCQQIVTSSGNVTLECPVSSGEKVVKNCYCDTSDEAWKTLATLEALNEMSHDIICSSSPP